MISTHNNDAFFIQMPQLPRIQKYRNSMLLIFSACLLNHSFLTETSFYHDDALTSPKLCSRWCFPLTTASPIQLFVSFYNFQWFYLNCNVILHLLYLNIYFVTVGRVIVASSLNEDLLILLFPVFLLEIQRDDELHLKGGSVVETKQIDSDECIIQM